MPGTYVQNKKTSWPGCREKADNVAKKADNVAKKADNVAKKADNVVKSPGLGA